MTRTLMVQGTGSDVGKSVIVAGLARVLKQRGIRVAPFKPQNMANNSFITSDGGEMGRAQVVQAEAAGIAPHVDMNPVLLKPTTDVGAQVILQGRVHSNMKALQYHAFKKEARRVVFESFSSLSRKFDVILIEGAGSPAEINLREGDIANMGFALEARCPVVLVGDINKGGVFASFVGTLELIAPEEAALVKGFIINKFRGDASLLEPAFEMISRRTGKPFYGTMPWIDKLFIQEEDGLHIETRRNETCGSLRVAVVVAKRMSNFTDFDPLAMEPGIRLDFVRPGEKLGKADLIILPGSKNTIDDFLTLKNSGLAREVLENQRAGAMVVGVCGGYQMLGTRIMDPNGVEGNVPEVEGLGLLEVETVMERDKVTAQAEGVIAEGALPWYGDRGLLYGYEIHMGRTSGRGSARSLMDVRRKGDSAWHPDGAVSDDGRVIGTYLHGIFDNDNFRTALLNNLRGDEGQAVSSFAARKEEGYDLLAAMVNRHLDVEALLRIIEEGA